MTYSKAIEELTIAIGHALDATKEYNDAEYRKKARRLSEEILFRVIKSRPFEPDPIIISEEDVKKAIRPVRIDTNR